ncbi:MAG TPA: beta-mannosidase [Gemmatirosa sp.]
MAAVAGASRAPGQAPTQAPVGARPFVRVQGGSFIVGDRPYHYLGANFWYGLQLGAADDTAGRARLVRELDRLKALGITNLRLLASGEGPASAPQRVVPPVQPAPGRYDERVLRGLDVVLAEMARRDMRGVLVLNNFFQWSGGMAQYVSWATGEPIPYPERDGHTWDEFQRYAARFYADARAQRLFDDYVRAVVGRTNTVTGVRYDADPTIMAWQLSNEPRGFDFSEAYVAWVDREGALVHRLAPRQLVSLGGEGKLDRGTPGTATQFARVSRSPALDYLTVHLWPENWGWFDPKNAAATWDRSIGRTMSYLADHVAIATTVGKPLVLEEFGVSRDGGAFAPGTPVTYRDRFFAELFEAVYRLASEPTVVAGANVWSWAGEGTPVVPGGVWRPGQPFTGDPPHERQGWYSIYATDSSTTALLRTWAGRMSGIDGRPVTAAR